MRRYRRDALGHRRLVVVFDGRDGFEVRFTTSCSGCFGPGEYGGREHDYEYDPKARCYLGSGCNECGYTGKRRRVEWVPFDMAI